MDLHTRVELIETLLHEAEQKTTALHHTLAAQARAKEEIPHAGHDTPLAHEGVTLQYEQDLWQQVCTHLKRSARSWKILKSRNGSEG